MSFIFSKGISMLFLLANLNISSGSRVPSICICNSAFGVFFINLVIPESGLEWNAVIGWRIATYYVPIVVTWILLVKLALGKYTRPETIQNECPVCGKLLSNSKFASHLEKEHKTE